MQYSFEKQYTRAEKHFRRAIELDLKYALAYAELGWILIKKQQYRPARKALIQAVKFNPNYYWSRLYLANVNWHLRRLKEAEEHYRAALQISPLDSLAYLLLGDFLSCEQRGNAEYYLKKAHLITPNDDAVLYHLGKHYYFNLKDEEAGFYLKKASRKGN